MLDQYGREIDYIRISVTDRCNLRCTYCMPQEGITQVKHEEVLSYAEIIRLCRIFASLGITKIKLTGGEPLIRKELSALIRGIKEIPGIRNVTLTTNGVLLKEQMQELYDAGIDAVTVSLDTMDAEMFREITRRDQFQNVIEGIREGLKYPDIRSKINCVPIAGVNDNQWVKLAEFARNYPIDVRFIEMMPIGLGRKYHGNTQEMIINTLEKVYGNAVPVQGDFGNGPGTYVEFPGFIGRIGFISAISHKFCSSCNRVRLTAEGYLKLCLQYTDGVDLREVLRNGQSDDEIRNLIKETIWRKPKSHQFTGGKSENIEEKQMSRIGG